VTSLQTPPPDTGTAEHAWWRHGVIYQVYIRSFADSDGDGIGDLGGIRSRLSYLRDLGVDAVWITPFYPSPMADGGYDVADYRDIEPVFGTLGDAEALVREAHELGLHVLIDIVPNHSSDQHEWFQAALRAAPGSPERERYIFRPGRGPDGALPPNDWESVFGGPAWQRVADGDWYLHLFAPEQPDFNWENAEVVEDFHRTLRFWLDRGVDGFRIDVANSLKKDRALPDLGDFDQDLLEAHSGPHHPIWDRDAVHEVYRGWRLVLEEYDGERAFVAEAWVRDAERLALYVRPDELHTAFNFDYLRAAWDAEELRATIDSCLATTGAVGAPTTWVLSNHDVTRHATRYARLDSTAGGVGEGERAGPDTPLDLELGLRRARAAALLTLALPGSAYLYQGEELGLPEALDLPEDVLQDPIWARSGHRERGRDGCRVPLPWSTDGPSLGFGTGKAWLPQPADWGSRSVAAQQDDPGSTLELYRAALAVRRGTPAFGEGPMSWIDSPAGTLAFERQPPEGAGSRVVCLVNLSDRPVPLPAYDVVLLASGPLDHPGTLPPDTTVWLR
jgi:alpha-glucosidase